MKSITVIAIVFLLFSCAQSGIRDHSPEKQRSSEEKQTGEEQPEEEADSRKDGEERIKERGEETVGKDKGEAKRPKGGTESDTGTIREKEEPKSELSYWKIVSQAKSYGSPDYGLLYRNGRPYFIRRDLFSDNRDDLLAVYLSNGEDGAAEFFRYSNISRLYEEEDTSFRCHIIHFFITDKGLVPENRYSFGKHKVLEDIRELQIKKGNTFPFAVILQFQSVEGIEEKWLIFAEKHVTRFQIKETFSNQPIVTDVDNNGTKDIIFFNKVFEEGSGYETFVTWYRWNGRDFIEHKTINIVRNLRKFLSKVKTVIIEEQCNRFVEIALRPEDAVQVERGAVNHRELCARVFVPVEEKKQENPLLSEEKEIVDIIYPEIMENPFMVEGVREEVFLLQMKVVTREGSFLYQAELAMPENPFSDRQFYFILQEDFTDE
jgi:hypothetical protein